jgi:two-component system, LytTR family, response regulator LytT
MTIQLRALVLEDEWPARNYLVQLLQATGQVHVVAAVPSTLLATEALRSAPEPVDLAFVDVQLAGEPAAESAGLLWLETCLLGPGAPRVILTTASREHALRAFELGVVDYLLKPFTLGRVRESLARVTPALERRPAVASPPRLVARRGRSLVFLGSGEAWAFEAEGRLCFVHTAEGRLDVDLSLSALEAVLGEAYLRVHRNWLVATVRVRSIERDGGEMTLLLGEGGRALRAPVARDRAAEIKERLLASSIGIKRDG